MVGTRTEHYGEMVAFYGDALGLPRSGAALRERRPPHGSPRLLVRAAACRVSLVGSRAKTMP